MPRPSAPHGLYPSHWVSLFCRKRRKAVLGSVAPVRLIGHIGTIADVIWLGTAGPEPQIHRHPDYSVPHEA